MAPSRTRKQPAREADYSNIGVAGRKTGVTLKDSGIRDEHGLEPIEGIFSSPEKPRPSRNGKRRANITLEEDDMDIPDSSIPEPTEVLTSRRIYLPPRSRSPIKTNLKTSPRKSAGTRSSPSRSVNGGATTDLADSVLDASLVSVDSVPTPTIEKSITARLFGSAPNTANGTGTPISGRKRKRIFDLEVTESEGNGADEPADTTTEPVLEDNVGGEDESLAILNGQDSLPLGQDPGLEDTSIVTEDLPPPKRKRGRPKTSKLKQMKATEDAPVSGPKSANPVRARKGKALGNQASKLLPSAEEFEADQSVMKILDTHREKQQEMPAKKPTRARRKPPPSQRKPNARISGDTTRDIADPDKSVAIRGKPKPRGLQILRTETPAAEDVGAQVLRSGRTSVKPIAFWRNERIVYDKPRLEGKLLSLPGIKEITRTKEQDSKSRPRGRKRSRKPPVPSELDGVDENQEEWELAPGVLEGTVMQWDPIAQKGTEEDVVETELAFAPKGLEDATREVKGASFQYGKTVTLPFFHSGIVDIPPGGEKRMKNSRKNHMVFWIFSGRVDVDVSHNKFSIGRGGMFQVSRGNFYSLGNPYDSAARVFFAQGCYMAEEEGLGGSAE